MTGGERVLLVVPGRRSRAAGIDARWIAAVGLAGGLGRASAGVEVLDGAGLRDPANAIEQSVRDTPEPSTARGVVRRLPASVRPAIGDIAAWRGNRALAGELRALDAGTIGAVVQFHRRFQRAGIDFARQLALPVAIRVEAMEVREEESWGVRRPGYGRFVERVGELDLLRRADLVVPVSNELDATLARAGIPDHRRLVVPNGVDLAAFAPAAPGDPRAAADPFVVGWVGGFRPFHGLGMVEAFVSALRAEIPDAVVELVGAGPLRHDLESIAGRAGGGLRVTGPIAHGDVPDRLRRFDACVLFSEPGPFHYSPLKLLEYLACGRPVVAPRVGDLGSWLHNGRDALLVPPADAGALARGVASVAKDPALATSLGIEGRRTAERLASWDEAARSILDTLRTRPPVSAEGTVDEPRFSVIVPTHGRPELLREAVDSVLAQTERRVECVVVDDAGDPPVGAFDDARVRVIRLPENRGLSAARNAGIREARGRFVTFLDDDDLLTPDRLAIADEGLGRAPLAICFRGNHPGGEPGRNRVLEGRVHDEVATEAVPHVGQSCVAREVLPLFDDDLRAGEEVDWWLRVTRDLSVATVPRIGYLFRIHSGERVGNGSVVRMHARIEVLDLHAEYFRSHPRAAAFQWKRVGLLAEQAGDRAAARHAFAKALTIRPEAASVWHLARTSLPGSRRHVPMGSR